MLQSGIKASMAIRIFGDSLEGLAEASFAVAEQLKTVNPYVNAVPRSIRISYLGKPYIEFTVSTERRRLALACPTMMVNQR